MPDHHSIVCGTYPRPPSVQAPLALSTSGSSANVNLNIEDISRKMVRDVPPVLTDLLEIATYIYCADQAIKRGGRAEFEYGKKWRRSLEFYIPVREPKRWSSDRVRTALTETVSFLSDDDYEFHFMSLKDAPSIETYLHFRDTDDDESTLDSVVLFSGGMDSLAGAIREAVTDGRSVALVSHRAAPKVHALQKRLVSEFRKHCSARLWHVPVWINKDSPLTREDSQRSRSFLYASLGAVVARMLGLSRILLCENGIVSVNLPISEQLVGARATRTTHPQVIKGLNELFSALFETEFEVKNPFMWSTRADVVRLIREASAGDLIKHTVSCSHTLSRSRDQPHCGACSQCIGRRFATLSGGCSDDEDPPGGYRKDVILGERESTEERTLVESFVRHAQAIEQATDDEITMSPEAIRAIRGLTPVAASEAADKLVDLHRRHAGEVGGVIEHQIAANAGTLRRDELPPTCLLRMAIPDRDREVGSATGRRLHSSKRAANQLVREPEFWLLRFEGKEIRLVHGKGLDHLSVVLGRPGTPIRAFELQQGIPSSTRPAVTRDSDTGPDARARKDYKRRLESVESELDRARRDHDLARIERLEEEKDALVSELQHAVGFGRRPPRESEDQKRARQAVCKALNRTIDKIAVRHRSLARHLDESIDRGASITYAPHPPITWEVLIS